VTEEIGGLEAQREAKSREIELIHRELQETEKLWDKNLSPLSKLIAMQREAARVEGERAQLIASVAQARAKIAETRLQIIQLDRDLKTEVMKDLREAQAKEAELIERRVSAEDQLKRVDIRAPKSGIVHQLNVHTVGGVVTQSEPIMLIVPEGDALVIEAKIAPHDIDRVHMGQDAFVRFTAFNQRTTPEFKGTVVRIAADLTKVQQTGQTYYLVRVSLPEVELKRLGQLKLVPGMPSEVFISTTERTALSYLFKPLRDQIARAFAEQ
jgi:HlyD family secretion protein